MRNFKFFSLITGIVFFTETLCAQSDSKEYLQIYIKEFSVYFQPYSCIGKMEVDLFPKGKIIVDLFECKGRMSFKVFDSKKKLVTKGTYTNSFDTLKNTPLESRQSMGVEKLKYYTTSNQFLMAFGHTIKMGKE